MITSTLSETAEEQGSPLSEESEREILRMVEEQLARPNPPNTKVLYRRAMHFIDRDVRRLSLQQFNAKFPLQVKRRRARERADVAQGASSEARSAGSGTPSDGRSGNGSSADARPEDGPGAARRAGEVPSSRDAESGGREELRRDVRSALIDYARLVGAAESRAELIDAVRRVDEYVDRATGESDDAGPDGRTNGA